MIIDKTIAESYFVNRSLNKVRDHWIYRSIKRGENLLCEPNEMNYDHLKIIYQQILEIVKNFKPFNKKVWVEFFGSQYIPKDIVVYIVIGLKEPYDVVAFNDKVGNHAIILDVAQLSKHEDALIDYIEKFLTHEIAHIIIHRTYPIEYHDLPQEVLKYLVFDEGIANFLSYTRDSLTLNWYSEEMNERRKNAYSHLVDTYNSLTRHRFMEWDKGENESFWEQYITVSGMFSIADYYYQHNRNSNLLKNIVNDGPDCLIETIKKATLS